MRRAILCLMLAALLVIPAAAQDRVPVPDIVRYAEYAPGDAALYAAIRMDAGFRETMNALLARLEPLVGDTDINDFFEDIFNEDELFSFAGDALVLTVLSPAADFGDLLDDGSPVAITFGIKDFEAAKTFIEDGLGGPMEDRNGWLVYEEDEVVRAMLRGDVMIVSPDFAFTDQLLSGDYGKLTNDARFQDTLARLPLPNYDFIVYADLTSIAVAQHNRPEPVTQGREDDTASDAAAADTAPDAVSALTGALGSVAIGGVNVGGRDLLLDAIMLYGDTGALAALGLDPEELGAPAVDLTFASRVAGDTQFYMQSTNLGGLLQQTFDFLNVAGAIMAGDASTGYFGLEGYVNDKMGATLKTAAGFGLGAATGLNLDADVIDVLEGDFALFSSVQPDPSGMVVPSMGIVLDESGQGENYSTAVVSMLDRAGYPITRVPLRDGGEAIDLSALTDPFMASMLNRGGSFDAASDPRFDVWFGAGDGVMAFGTAPTVQFALGPSGESLADNAAYQHAVESVFLDGAQGIMFFNIGALESLAFDEYDEAFIALVESISASARADTAGITGRFAVSLK
jgi:hypothetical protein